MDTWQAKWKPPRPVHNNPCLVLGSSEEEALKEAFSQYGSVSETFSPKGQNFTFVHFGKQIALQTNADNSSHACVRVLSETEICLENVEDKYDAEKAMNALNNTKIGGKQVKVTDGKCANREVNEWRASLLRGK